MTRKSSLHLFILSSCLLAILLWRGPANLWSLQYWWAQNGQGSNPGPPPSSHAMAPIWQAEDELRITSYELRGSSVEGISFVNPKSKIVNRFAARINGNIAAVQGDLKQATQFWAEARDVRSLGQVAQESQAAEAWDEATLALQALHFVNPDQGTLPLANYLFQQNEADVAQQLLTQAIADLPQARNRLSWLTRLAALHQGEQAWQEAESVYLYALSEYPNDISTPIALGQLAHQRGQGVEAALAWFEQAAQRDRNSGYAFYVGATLLGQEQRYAEADDWYAQAIERQPQNQGWYVVRGNLLREAGDLVQAIQVYEQAVARFSSYAQAYYELAWAYRLAERGEKALGAIERAVALVDGENVQFEERAMKIREWMSE